MSTQAGRQLAWRLNKQTQERPKDGRDGRGRGGGLYDRDAPQRAEYNSDEEDFDEFGRRRKKKPKTLHEPDAKPNDANAPGGMGAVNGMNSMNGENAISAMGALGNFGVMNGPATVQPLQPRLRLLQPDGWNAAEAYPGGPADVQSFQPRLRLLQPDGCNTMEAYPGGFGFHVDNGIAGLAAMPDGAIAFQQASFSSSSSAGISLLGTSALPTGAGFKEPPLIRASGTGIIYSHEGKEVTKGNLTIQQIHKRLPCKFFQEGRCKQGAECEYSHNIDSALHTVSAGVKKKQYCNYFGAGKCVRGSNCPFMHGSEEMNDEKLRAQEFQDSVATADFVDFETGLPRSALPKVAAPVPKPALTVTVKPVKPSVIVPKIIAQPKGNIPLAFQNKKL